jgi:hypothetical protein
VALLALAGGALAGFQLFKRLGGDQGRNRVDLYYEDGSLVTLTDAEATPLLARAREALRAIQSV